MKESKVLVLNLTGAVTELCRHLVLSGINLEVCHEPSIVSAVDYQHEFLYNPSTDVGRPVLFFLFVTSIEKHCDC